MIYYIVTRKDEDGTLYPFGDLYPNHETAIYHICVSILEGYNEVRADGGYSELTPKQFRKEFLIVSDVWPRGIEHCIRVIDTFTSLPDDKYPEEYLVAPMDISKLEKVVDITLWDQVPI